MSIEISDMIEFVSEISKMSLPETSSDDTVKFNNLREDVAREFGKVFDKEIKVLKVQGV